MLAIESYEVAYATLQALHTHGLDLHEEFDGGEIDLHKGSGKTLEDFKCDIARHLKIDMQEDGMKCKAAEMLKDSNEDELKEASDGDNASPQKKKAKKMPSE